MINKLNYQTCKNKLDKYKYYENNKFIITQSMKWIKYILDQVIKFYVGRL